MLQCTANTFFAHPVIPPHKVALAELSLLVSVLSVAYGWFFQDYPPNVGLALGALCIVASLAALVRTELVARSTRTSDKIMCVIYGAGALVAAMMTQVKDPLWAPTQRQALAVRPLNDLVRAWGGRVRAPPKITLAGLRWALAGAAGALASILLIPTLRFASALDLQRRVPAWASDYIPDSLWLRTRLHIQFIAPLVASMLWGSMRADVLFRVPPSHARLIQAAALILAALASLANVSLLVQRYLDTGLLAWYSLRVPVEGGLTDAGLRRELVRRKVSLTGLLAGRAAVQAVAPAVLLLGMGLVQLHNGLHPGLSREADVNGLLDVMLGFLAWWVGASTFLFGATHIWVIDTPGV